MLRAGIDVSGQAAAKGTDNTVFISRFIGQLALGDPAVARTIERLQPFIENVEYRDELVGEAIGVIIGKRRIRSGSDLFRRLTFGRPAVGMVLFQATRGRSIDLISVGQLLVIAVRDLVAAKRAGKLAPFSPRIVSRPLREDEVEREYPVPSRSGARGSASALPRQGSAYRPAPWDLGTGSRNRRARRQASP